MNDRETPQRLSNPFRRRSPESEAVTLPDLDLDDLLGESQSPPRSASPTDGPQFPERRRDAVTLPAPDPVPSAGRSQRPDITPLPATIGPAAAAAPPSARSSTWRYQADAWRLTRRITQRQADLLLRLRSGRAIPAAMRARIASLGLPDDVIDETLHAVRSLGDWSDAWIETAQRYLGEFRRNVSAGNQIDGARFQAMAALCYHVAQLVPDPDDARTAATCRAASASLFNQALPYVHPNAARLTIPWRTKMLPSYLLVPTDLHAHERCGLVVLLNGSTTSKEAMLTWALPMVRSGLAILAIDNPGTGEASRTPADPEQDDLIDGVFTLLANDPRIDLAHVVVAGLGIGGNLAIRCAISDRRIAAAAAITPLVTPSRWLGRAYSLFHHDLLAALGETSDAQEHLSAFDLDAIVEHVKFPVLVIGAGRDVLAPPNEAQRLAGMIGPLATLDWFSSAGHGMYDQIASGMNDLAAWTHAVLEANATLPVGAGESRVQRSLAIADAAREALMSAPVLVDLGDGEPDTEGARLLTDDEILDDDPDWYAASRNTASHEET